MRRLCILLLSLLASTAAAAAKSPTELQPDEIEVLEFVLSTQVPLDLIESYHMDPATDIVVLPNRTIGVWFPPSVEQIAKYRRVDDAIKAREEITPEMLEEVPVDPGKDLALGEGKVISRELVLCGISVTDYPARIPKLSLHGVIKVRQESAENIDATFRTDNQPSFKELYPGARGVVQVSRPCLSADGKVAGVFVSFLGTKLGGGGDYFLLRRESSGWRIQDVFGVYTE